MELSFCSILRELTNNKYSSADVGYVLSKYDFSNDDLFDFSEENIDLIVSAIHSLYTKHDMNVRSILLRVCCMIELNSNEYITEKYKFDYLIARSLSRKSKDDDKVNEEVKSAIDYIQVVLKFRKMISQPVLTGIVIFYEKSNKEIKDQLIWLFAEISLKCNYLEIQDVSRILVNYLMETGSKEISLLFSYCLEKRLSLTNNDYLLSLLIPFSQTEKSEVLFNVTNALIDILRTWSGAIKFGIEKCVFQKLILCLPNEINSVILIFRHLLKLNEKTIAITDSFTGFCLSVLLKLGLIKSLNQVLNKNEEAFLFLNELLPYTNYNYNDETKNNFKIQESQNLTSPEILNPQLMLFEIANTMAMNNQLTSINGFNLAQDSKYWNWDAILIMLTVVLPNNDSEAQSQVAKQLYQKLFTFFSGPFLSVTPGKVASISDILFALIKFLSSKGWGNSLIETNTGIKNAFFQSLLSIIENHNIDLTSPQWFLFKCFASFISEASGISIIRMWEFDDILISLGAVNFDESTCRTILGLIKLYPETELSILILKSFLSSPNNEIHRIAIEDLQQKRSITPNFCLSGYKGLLIPHIKDIEENNLTERFPIVLNLIGEIISTDKECLKLTATDKKLHEILSKHSHYIYSYLLSIEEGHEYANINDEIQWWMNIGNHEYISVYNCALKYSFSGNLSISETKQPAIINYSGYTTIPPHLFGQLSKTKNGINLIEPFISTLIDQLSLNSHDIGSFFALSIFASNHLTEEIVEKYDIAEKIYTFALNSSSSSIKGMLISSLSIFYKSKYFLSFLQKHNWNIFNFGCHQCVLPSNILNINEPPTTKPTQKQKQMPEIPNSFQGIIQLLINLSNPLYTKTLLPTLHEYYNQNPKLFENSQLANYSHFLLGNYTYPYEVRQIIYTIFQFTPIWQQSETINDQNVSNYIEQIISNTKS